MDSANPRNHKTLTLQDEEYVSKERYLTDVLDATPRLLSLLDRNPMSDTYGCFDRLFWHYTAIDFPCARMQEAVLTLALLYKTPHEKNIYYGNETVLEWINASLSYWMSMQDGDGSFSEWYPNEHSFVATTFSSYAVSETLLVIEDGIRERCELIKALKKSAKWLKNRNENQAVNQGAGVLIFLCNMFHLTRDEEYRTLSKKKLSNILDKQDDEGWFPEYGGADVGYLSLAIDYLAKYYEMCGNDKLLKRLQKSINFISYLIPPNGVCGGVFGSRNTAYLIPHGFEILSKNNPMAASIANYIREETKSTMLCNVDDRYLTYVTYTNLQAYNASKDTIIGEDTPNRFNQEFIKNFPNAGLWICSNKDFYIIVNYKKGGAFRAYSRKNNKSVQNSGVMIETSNGNKYTSSQLSDRNMITATKHGLNVSGNLHKITSNRLTPTKNVLLRMFQLTIGRSDKVSQCTKSVLRRLLITGKNPSKMRFNRSIIIEDNVLKVTDSVNVDGFKRFISGGDASHIYTPSSRYFQGMDSSKTISVPSSMGDESKMVNTYSLTSQRIID